uniref:Uncharacterized protein n=1 Tax=Arundo donax TaxID=35708 RepID=A0A0A9GHP4_ARUDO
MNTIGLVSGNWKESKITQVMGVNGRRMERSHFLWKIVAEAHTMGPNHPVQYMSCQFRPRIMGRGSC